MKTKFVSKYGKPITGAHPRMKPTPITGLAGTEQQAESQIKASPMPFQNPRGAIRGVESHQGFKDKQVQSSTGGGVRPRAGSAAAPRSEPAPHGTRMQHVGYASSYQAQYNPSTHPVARTRVMRGAIKGTKPLIDNSDVFSADSIKEWNRNSRGL